MTKVIYHLLDSRAGIKAMNIPTDNLDLVDEDWERYILLSSLSAREIVYQANKGDYGELCVVSKDNKIMWEWHVCEDVVWKIKK